MDWLKENWGVLVFWLIVAGTAGFIWLSPDDTEPATENSVPSFQESNTFDRFDDPTQERSPQEYGDYDCTDFSSQYEAQDFFESEGGPHEDYHNLDRDGDGIACESN
jgi:hypothetical protein